MISNILIGVFLVQVISRSNTDASVRMDQGKAYFGGIARDDAGKWMLGYYAFIGNTKITEAELWSIHQGLKIPKDKY